MPPRLFNLIYAHCTPDFRALLQGRAGWQDTLDRQDGVELVRLIHALHHLQDESKPGMWEIVQQDRALFICTKKQNQTDANFVRAFQSTVDTINEAGGAAGVTPCSLELVCTEQNLVWTSIPDNNEGKEKKLEIQKEESSRYLACAAFTGLDGRRHGEVKMNVKNTYASQKIDILPNSMPDLLQLIQAFEEPAASSATTRRDPKHPSIAMVEAADKRTPGGGPDVSREGDDMTGIVNKQGRKGCDKCGAPGHWKATCPHKNKTEDKLKIIRARNGASPQLVKVTDTDKGNAGEELEEIWVEEGVACVSPTAGFETPKLDPDKLYLDSCASHSQMYLEGYLTELYETQMGLHTISNGGPSTACEYGYILGAIEAWLLRTGIANLLSIPAVECKGFRVQSDTYADWIVTSPGGTCIVFK